MYFRVENLREDIHKLNDTGRYYYENRATTIEMVERYKREKSLCSEGDME